MRNVSCFQEGMLLYGPVYKEAEVRIAARALARPGREEETVAPPLSSSLAEFFAYIRQYFFVFIKNCITEIGCNASASPHAPVNCWFFSSLSMNAAKFLLHLASQGGAPHLTFPPKQNLMYGPASVLHITPFGSAVVLRLLYHQTIQ